jgi:predicted DNA-binding transcriptional regulator YafY
MDEPEPIWRWISPAALGSDGVRWHLRAYNHDRGRYEDFLFPRMLQLGSTRACGDLPADTDWERCVAVLLKPAARLSAGQRAVIEADYGMVDGVVRLEVRAALLALFLRRMGLDRGDGLVDIANRAEVEAEVKRVASRFA